MNDPYLAELQEAVARRYAERTVDALPAEPIADFRPRPGRLIDTYGWMAEENSLDANPYVAAEAILDAVLDLERRILDANPTAGARLFLMGRQSPVTFRRIRLGAADHMRREDTIERLKAEGASEGEITPIEEIEAGEKEIKIRRDFGVRVRDGEPILPHTAEYVGGSGEYPPWAT